MARGDSKKASKSGPVPGSHSCLGTGPYLCRRGLGRGGGGEGSAFVSFKTQGQLIPEAFHFQLVRPANVLDQIVQVLSSGAGLVMSKGFLGSPLIRLVYFVTTM